LLFLSICLRRGSEPLANAIAVSCLAMLRRPGLAGDFLSQESQTSNRAVDEFLRYESPFLYAGRIAVSPLNLHSSTVQVGERVLLMLGAANRDERVFSNPDCLDIRRDYNPHWRSVAGATIVSALGWLVGTAPKYYRPLLRQ